MKTLRRFAWLACFPILMLGFTGCSDDEGGSSGPSGSGLEGNLSGTISGTHTMTGDVLVPAGETLTINSGTRIIVKGKYKFQVEGRLDAVGDEDNFIVFDSEEYPREKGDWMGIWFVEADDASVMKYVRVTTANKYNIIEDTTRAYRENGEAFIDTVLHRGAITIRDCSPTVERCIIDYGGYDGIHIVGESSPTIIYNTIVLNAFNGIRIEPSWPDEHVYGTPEIANNIIVENDDAGIRGPNGIETFIGDVLINYNDIWNNASPNYLPPPLGNWATLDVHLDPQFINLEEGDYTLHPCSGAVDQGDPDDGTDADQTRKDVGVFPLFQATNHLAHSLKGDRLTLTTNYGNSGEDFYLVTCDVLVEEGDELRIDPGVEIRFAEAFSFEIEGEMRAEGTGASPIVFTSGREVKNRADWNIILFDNASSESVMRNVIVEYASVDNIADPQYIGAISMEGSSPTLENISIYEAYNSGIYCNNGSSPEMDNILIENVGVYGIYCSLNSSPTISRTEINSIQGYGMYITMNSSPHLQNVLIYDATVSGIVIEQICNPVLENVTVYGPEHMAVRIESSCNPDISNSIFASYGSYGIVAWVTSFPTIDYVCIYPYEESLTPPAPLDPASLVIPNLVTDDPMFADPDNGDFHLQAGSPCAGAGSDGTDLGAYGGSLSW